MRFFFSGPPSPMPPREISREGLAFPFGHSVQWLGKLLVVEGVERVGSIVSAGEVPICEEGSY